MCAFLVKKVNEKILKKSTLCTFLKKRYFSSEVIYFFLVVYLVRGSFEFVLREGDPVD